MHSSRSRYCQPNSLSLTRSMLPLWIRHLIFDNIVFALSHRGSPAISSQSPKVDCKKVSLMVSVGLVWYLPTIERNAWGSEGSCWHCVRRRNRRGCYGLTSHDRRPSRNNKAVIMKNILRHVGPTVHCTETHAKSKVVLWFSKFVV